MSGDRNTEQSGKGERAPLWVWLLAAVIFAAPLIGVVIWRAYTWQCATAWFAARWVILGLGIALLVTLLIGPTLLAARKEASAHLPRAGRRAAWSIGAILATGMIGQGLATNLASSFVYDYAKAAEPSVGEFYRNHDSTRLAGRTVRMVLLRVRDGETDDAQKRALADVANLLPEAWVDFATGPDRGEFALVADGGEGGGVDEPQLAAFLADRNRDALSPERWGDLLDTLCDQRGVGHLSGAARAEACDRLTDTFAYSLREAFKHAWTAGDKAWAGLMLDAVTQSLDSARRGADERDAIWRIELTKLGDDFAALRRLEGALSEAQARRHANVLARFDRLESKVDQVLAEVRGLRDDFNELTGSLAAAGAGGGATLPTITPELRGSLERLLASGDPIDRAMAAIASVERPFEDSTWTAADEQLRIADVWRTSGVNWTVNDEFRYRMALGNRRFFNDDPDGARPEYEEAVRMRPGDPDAVIMLSRSLSESRGRAHGDGLARARALLETLLDTVGGLNPVHEAVALNNLALILDDMGELHAARNRLERSIEIYESEFGTDNPVVATSYSNLAVILKGLGELKTAGEFARRAVEIDERYLTPNHPALATHCSNLALLLQLTGNTDEATVLLERSLSILIASLPSNHVALAKAHSNLAQVLLDCGELKSAKEHVELAALIGEAVLAPDHPLLATIYCNEAMLQQKLGNTRAALDSIDRAIAIEEGQPRPVPSVLSRDYSNRATILRDLGLLDAARESALRAVDLAESALPPNHPQQAACYSNLATVLSGLGQIEQARDLMQRAIEIHEAAMGPAHPQLAIMHSNLANILQQAGELEAAEEHFRKAIAIMQAAQGPGFSGLASQHWHLSRVLFLLGQPEAACEELRRAIEIEEACFGPTRPALAAYSSDLAMVLQCTGDFEAARAPAERAVKIADANLAPNDPERAIGYANLATILKGGGVPDEARAWMERAIELMMQDAALSDRELTAREWVVLLVRGQGDLATAIELLERLDTRARELLQSDDPRLKAYSDAHSAWVAELEAASDDLPDSVP